MYGLFLMCWHSRRGATAIVNGISEQSSSWTALSVLPLLCRFSLWNVKYSSQGHLVSLEYTLRPKINYQHSLTASTHFPLGSPSVATGPGLLTVGGGGVETRHDQQFGLKRLFCFPMEVASSYTIHTLGLGRLQAANVASWILLSVSARVRQGSTLYWMLVSRQVDWWLAGGWWVEGLWTTPVI